MVRAVGSLRRGDRFGYGIWLVATMLLAAEFLKLLIRPGERVQRARVQPPDLIHQAIHEVAVVAHQKDGPLELVQDFLQYLL